MFHLLVVDDERPTREQLKKLLEEVFPGSVVRTAGNVAAGKEEINRAISQDIPFDAVILDFRLPPDTGEAVAIDESQCTLIRGNMPQAFVIHITAYPDDIAVDSHMRESHYGVNAARDPISKLEAHWPRTMIDTLAKVLHRARIDREYNAIIADPSRSVVHPRSISGSHLVSATHELGGLMRNISQWWHLLDEGLKDRLRQTFEIQENTIPVQVTFKGMLPTAHPPRPDDGPRT